MVNCAKLYLAKGLIKQDHKTEKNQLFLKSTNLSFVDFMDSEKGEFFNNQFIDDKRHTVKDAVSYLRSQTNEDNSSPFNVLTSKTLKKWLTAYADYIDLTIDTTTRIHGKGLSFMFMGNPPF